MNKSELIALLSEQKALTHEESTMVVSTFFETIKNTLVAGGRVELRGFGSFRMKEYASYIGRNPKTGEKVVVAEKRMPVFKVGKELRELINK